MLHCLREAGAHTIDAPYQPITSVHWEYGSHRGAQRRQTHEVRSEGPSGAATSPSSHPDQFFFIQLVSYCPSGSSHFSMGVALPEFCLTSVSDKCLALTNINLCNVYVLACQVHEHCLGSAPIVSSWGRVPVGKTLSKLHMLESQQMCQAENRTINPLSACRPS